MNEQVERRVFGSYTTGAPGPTVMVQGGIHGNEPGGIHAAKRVLQKLDERRPAVKGKLVALAGNLEALRHGERFVDRDLNRLWLGSTIESLQAQDPANDCAEDREQRELLEVYEDFHREADGPVVFLDLHSSSADGPPFTCIADTLSNRHLALALPVPLILGLEEAIDGAVMDYFVNRGLVCLAVEGGQHDAESTIDNLEAAIWITLVEAGFLAAEDIDLAPYHETLRKAAGDVPPVVEITHRHVLLPTDEFVMEPGFISFQRIEKGQKLARDRRGEIFAQRGGRMLLPLYQGLGEDGFFTCRDVSPFWLRLARWVRHMQLDRFVHWLPGVSRSEENHNMLIVNPKIARWFVVEIFHLLGFRRRRTIGGRLTFTRRWTDAAAKAQYDV